MPVEKRENVLVLRPRSRASQDFSLVPPPPHLPTSPPSTFLLISLLGTHAWTGNKHKAVVGRTQCYPSLNRTDLCLSRLIDAVCAWAETVHLKHLREIVWEFLQQTGEEFVPGGLTLPLAKRYTKWAKSYMCKRGVGLFDNILALSGASLLPVSSQVNALSRFRDICGTVIHLWRARGPWHFAKDIADVSLSLCFDLFLPWEVRIFRAICNMSLA